MMALLPIFLLGMACLSGADILPIIPNPVEVHPGDGAFSLSADTPLIYGRKLANDAKIFARDLSKITGATVIPKPGHHTPGAIVLDINPELDLPASGYVLKVTPTGVRITGKDAAGTFYGTRTFLQLLPPGKLPPGPTAIPSVLISDYPRFSWRGIMLDCGRHLFPVEDIKRLIDALAYHKINIFHWHLTDDQGWRIEIKKHPKLTEVGGFRASSPPYGNRHSDDGVRYGGFYTQDQIRAIVAYAAERHITIVPEIEMPGHASAAIAAYPSLGNDDVAGFSPRVQCRWGIFHYTFAPKDETFQFLDDVLTEVCALFPSKYIHIGGDEAPKDQWNNSPFVRAFMQKHDLKSGHDLQSYFVKRIEKLLAAKGRKLIGWDEIREGGLSPDATVMSWRGEAGGIASAKEGHDAVMAVTSHLYFDCYQFPSDQELAKGEEHEAIGGFIPLEKTYSYNPIPKALTGTESKHILGVQAQLWTEFMKNFPKVEYQLFPRIAALAEIAWSPDAQKDFKKFRQRLEPMLKRYEADGFQHAPLSD